MGRAGRHGRKVPRISQDAAGLDRPETRADDAAGPMSLFGAARAGSWRSGVGGKRSRVREAGRKFDPWALGARMAGGHGPRAESRLGTKLVSPGGVDSGTPPIAVGGNLAERTSGGPVSALAGSLPSLGVSDEKVRRVLPASFDADEDEHGAICPRVGAVRRRLRRRVSTSLSECPGRRPLVER